MPFTEEGQVTKTPTSIGPILYELQDNGDSWSGTVHVFVLDQSGEKMRHIHKDFTEVFSQAKRDAIATWLANNRTQAEGEILP